MEASGSGQGETSEDMSLVSLIPVARILGINRKMAGR